MWVAIETYNSPGYNELIASAPTYDEIVAEVERVVIIRHEDSADWEWTEFRNVPKPLYYWYEDGGYDPSCIVLYEVK